MQTAETIRRWRRAMQETHELLQSNAHLMSRRAELRRTNCRILREFVAEAGAFYSNVPQSID